MIEKPTSNIQHSTSNIQGKKYDLEDRLLNYSIKVMEIVESLQPGMIGNHIGNQMLRAGTSPFFNHGEAQAAESNKDFVHKMKICLKELRETRRALLLVRAKPLTNQIGKTESLIGETEELIRIFFASIRTAKGNLARETPDFEYGSDASSSLEC
jgi:four helix bundle protein